MKLFKRAKDIRFYSELPDHIRESVCSFSFQPGGCDILTLFTSSEDGEADEFVYSCSEILHLFEETSAVVCRAGVPEFIATIDGDLYGFWGDPKVSDLLPVAKLCREDDVVFPIEMPELTSRVFGTGRYIGVTW